MRGALWDVDVPATPGMLDCKVVAASILDAEGGIFWLVHETGMEDPQGLTQVENRLCNHGFHACHGVDPVAAPTAAIWVDHLVALC